MVTAITEKNTEITDAWYKEAHEQTIESLPVFLKHLMDDYGHDYGTICKALGAGAVAASSAMDRDPHGGITGFQAGAVMWEFMTHWGTIKAPAKIVSFSDMLFPQYQQKFEKVISKDTWEWLQTEAKKELSELDSPIHPDVEAHWRFIAAGNVPFNYIVKE